MANRYWVGGTANWDTTAGTKWATTSGGAGGAAVPTAADDVYFDAASGSGNCSVNSGGAICRSIDTTGYTGTLTIGSGQKITVGGSSGGALTIGASTTMVYGNTTSGWQFSSTSTNGGLGWGINSNGKNMGAINFVGVGGRWRFDSNIASGGTQQTTHTGGTIDLNGYTFSTGVYASTGSTARSLIQGTSAITCTSGSAAGWNVYGPNFTYTWSTGATITVSGSNGGFAGNGLSYPTVIWPTSAGGSFTINGSNTFENLTLSGGSNQGSSVTFAAGTTTTITGTLTINSPAVQTRAFITSISRTVQATISAGTVTATYANFQSINATGAASWNGPLWGDVGNNTGITFSASQTNYLVGLPAGTTSIENNSLWASSSGGTGGTGRIPLAHDDVVLDGNSGTAGATAAFRLMFWGSNFTATNSSVNVVFSGATNIQPPLLLGNIAFPSDTGRTFTTGTGSLYLYGRGSHTITGSRAYGGGVYDFGTTPAYDGSLAIATLGTYTVVGNLSVSNGLVVSTGTLDTNGVDLNVSYLNTQAGSSLLLRSGTHYMRMAASTAASFASNTVTAGTSTIRMVYGGARTIQLNANSFGTIRVDSGTGQVNLTASGANIGTLILYGPRTVAMTAGGTGSTWIIGTLEVVGDPTKIVTLISATPGTRVVHTTTRANVFSASLTDNENKVPGVAYNSTSVSNNVGWTFVNDTYPDLVVLATGT